MSKIAVIGAGKTGRGFIGRLLTEAGKEIMFVDKNEALVEKLNAEGGFTVEFFGKTREAVRVDNYKAYTWENADFADAELVFVSVCGQNLKDVGAKLTEKLDAGKKYYLITCENASHPSKTLREAIEGKNVAVSEATVFCTTIESDGYNINSENYPYLQCDAELLEGYVPEVASVRTIGSFSDFLTRKLFTYNAASCVIAYIGALKGYTDYGEAANDEEILKLLDKNYGETNAAMCKRFGYDEEDQREFAALSKAKFCNRTIIDTIARNAREPHRKLGGGERIIGAAKLIREFGGDASVLELTAAAAVLYEDSADANWTAIKAEKGEIGVLKDICLLNEDEAIFKNIIAYIEKIKADRNAVITETANN
ncbi:MAG: NAD(P)-binding domain-containing protein [Oscillospiraceae bacterium]|nr:NAD(P)-binding domain-containing protein [Oscillospiraceae bacterium]